MKYLIGLNTKNGRKEIVCDENESLRDAIIKGYMGDIPRGCGGGGCGICKIRVTRGEVDMKRMSCNHITEEDKKNNIVLACCARPKTNIDLSFCNLDI